MKQLLALKAEYKQQTGQDYKPGQAPATPVQTQSSSYPQAQELFSQVAQQGELVRKLKSEKAPKVRNQSQSGIKYCPEMLEGKATTAPSFQDHVDEAVKTLLDLKSKYKTLTGEEYKPVAAAGATGGEEKNRKEKENKSEKQGGAGGGKKGKGDKAGQGKESSGGAGGSGEGQGPKKQTRWESGNKQTESAGVDPDSTLLANGMFLSKTE